MKKVLICIYNVTIYELIRFFIKKDIYYNNLHKENDCLMVEIDYKNIKILKKNFNKKNVEIIKYYGLKGAKEYLKKEYIFLLSSILGIVIIYILSNVIFSINIVTSNKKLSTEIKEELENYGIEKYNFIKSYKEIEKIKKNILDDNKDKLEWMEISRKGTKITVNLTERIKNEKNESGNIRNIISKKDALILKLVNRRGMVLKTNNDYVRKGEVIVSGSIIRGEEIVNYVESDADVFGEVWYTVNVTVPYEYIEYTPSKKIVNHYYLDFPGFNLTLAGYYNKQNVISEKEVLIDKPYLLFKLIREKKTIYNYKKYIVSEKEALEEAIKRAERSISVILSEEEYIIDKKVLKYSTFSSKINVEVFFRVYENIVDYSIINNTLESE